MTSGKADNFGKGNTQQDSAWQAVDEIIDAGSACSANYMLYSGQMAEPIIRWLSDCTHILFSIIITLHPEHRILAQL